MTDQTFVPVQPVLEALCEAGGMARRQELEIPVERLMATTFQPADREKMAGGQERWQLMIRRVRKHLIAEGWIEDRSSPVWRITNAGRRTVQKISESAE